MSEDFDKERKLCFICSCKQTRETSISQKRIRPSSSAGTPSAYHRYQKWKKSDYYVWNMHIFLTYMYGSTTGGLYSPPEPCEARFIMDACTLFNIFWTVEQKHPPAPVIKLRSARTIVYITPIGFNWKKKVIYTYIPRGWVKHRLIFICGGTTPLNITLQRHIIGRYRVTTDI